MAHKSYRERYFEDNEATRISADNKKGYRIVYRYVGLWKAWRSETMDLKRVKFIVFAMELFSFALFMICVLLPVPINTFRLANGFGCISLIPWILELSGVVRFLISKEYVHDLSYQEIDRSIRIGCCIRICLVAACLLCGLSGLVAAESFAIGDFFVAAGIACSGVLSYLVSHFYCSLKVDTFRNEDGKPGTRY